MTILKQLKTQINRLEALLSPMKRNVIEENNNVIHITFSDTQHSLSIVCYLTDGLNNKKLPVEEQTITINLFNSTSNETESTKHYNLEDANNKLQQINDELSRTPFLLHRCHYMSSISIPKIRNMLYGIEYSKEDNEAFLELFKPYIKRHSASCENLKEMKKDCKSDKSLYFEEFNEKSKEHEIKELKAKLEKMEKAEAKLVQDLEDKYSIKVQEQDIVIKSKNHKHLIDRYFFKASEIIRDNSFNINFKSIEDLLD